MGFIKDNYQFVRSIDMENEAINRIAELFDTQWETTSQKTPREITALVLETIAAACLLQEKKEDTPESLRLLHANQFFSSTCSLLRSSSPISITITGTTFDETLHNLRRIRTLAEKEEYGSEIIDRLNFFINSLQTVLNEMVKGGQRQKFLGGFILLGAFLLFLTIFIDNDPLFYVGLFVMGGGILYAAAKSIINI